ncbi:RNA polymerase sigma factor [Rhizosphaericola mali]|uniref:Sigma-70 family RNA polymerase sigma factor n=1 Tax=Rhizosphaericola mali TaxID=2545455 RepID=A0A5P2GFM8_9BACT|nr:sigma-70 family RNA polymerase sigma factor [Rhizosphaericola mali]QES90431.1 sigma-70 family RNA polymerase sigma factor [Rhizosphaericola mali]
MNEEQLIHHCKSGKRLAQKQLFELYANGVMVICFRYVKDRVDAEELMLNSFTQFFKKMDFFNYRGAGSVSAYLKKIAINESLQFLRSKKSIYLHSELTDVVEDNSEDSLDKMSAKEIMDCLMTLPDGYRTIFNLYVLESWTHEEIAQSLQISTGTSKSQLSKARKMMQKILTENKRYGTEKLG